MNEFMHVFFILWVVREHSEPGKVVVRPRKAFKWVPAVDHRQQDRHHVIIQNHLVDAAALSFFFLAASDETEKETFLLRFSSFLHGFSGAFGYIFVAVVIILYLKAIVNDPPQSIDDLGDIVLLVDYDLLTCYGRESRPTGC